jgi:hypothetical protein
MGTPSRDRLRQTSLILLASLMAASVSSAKKAQPVVLNWKMGILWESPDPCNDTSPIWKETFLILADDTLYHLAHTPVLHKPNVTEGKPVSYDIAQGDFYLEDDDGRVFKLSIVKKELDPTALERFNSGKLQCQPQ